MQPVTFYFRGRRLEGVAGQPIAKALFHAGIRTLSYSVKYKRPRGIHCARGRCIMCHMEVNGVPGVPTCITPLAEGMRIEREDYRPFYAPLLVAAARLVPFPAGFYYRMFTRPSFLRRFFLGSLRRMAGVGRISRPAAENEGSAAVGAAASGAAPAKKLSSRYDVIVVGAGVSGMAAALEATRRGATVLLVDEYPSPGGHSRGALREAELASKRDDLVSELAEAALDYAPLTTAQAFFAPDTLLLGAAGATGFPLPSSDAGAAVPRGLRRVQAGTFVFATGAYDVVPLFENGDTAGVFGARSIRLLLERDRWRPGKRAVVYGSGEVLSDARALLEAHGIDVACTVDAGGDDAGDLSGRVRRAYGGAWLSGVTLALDDGTERRVTCDLLCTAFPGQSAYELPYQAGFRYSMTPGKVLDNRVLVPHERYLETDGVRHFVVGEAAGESSWREKLRGGLEAGRQATESLRPQER